MSEPSTPTGIPSPLWTENQRQAAVIAQLRGELAAERERAARAEGEAAGLLAGYADLQAAVIAQLRDELAAERERVERAEGEAAGLRQGYAEMQAAVAQANTELAAARAVIAGIQARFGWAEARIREAIGDE